MNLVAFVHGGGLAADVAKVLAVEQDAPHGLDGIGGPRGEPGRAAGVEPLAGLPFDLEDFAAACG